MRHDLHLQVLQEREGVGLVLQQAQSFYLNPYLRHYDFYYLRYRVDTRVQREHERQEALEAQRARARHAVGRRR